MKRKKIIIISSVVFVFMFMFFALKGVTVSKFIWQYIFQKNIELKKRDSKINVLFLGIGGGAHEGPNLTDTIIFANIDPENKKVTLLSIPRDLYVEELKAKINFAYAFGESKRKGGGLVLAKKVISKITNQPVDYAVRIDFNGFIKAVDLVNGIDVGVENVLDDYEYPIEGKQRDTCGQPEEDLEKLATASSQLEAFPCRYKHVYFNKGLIHMNGEEALEFVRSRHAIGKEGTDFARSKRQEKVILAFRNKIFSFETMLNPKRMIDLYTVTKDSIDMDIKEDELDDFVKLAEKVKDAKIKSVVLDYGDEEENRYGLLINPPVEEFDGQWVLSPRAGRDNYKEIQKYIDCEIKIGNCAISPIPTY